MIYNMLHNINTCNITRVRSKIYTMVFNMYSPDLQFSLAVLQLKAAISDACTRAAETLRRRRDERGADHYSQLERSQDLSDGSAWD